VIGSSSLIAAGCVTHLYLRNFVPLRHKREICFLISSSLMEKILRLTSDGSHTIAVPEIDVTYHSIHGAIQESKHVFINAGLQPLIHQFETIRIFEMGFGTGLNALLSLQQSITHNQKIFYYGVELFPLGSNYFYSLNFSTQLQDDSLKVYFNLMHESDWEKDIPVHPLFVLHKTNQSLLRLSIPKSSFNLIFFDAFAPTAQPDLWTQDVFEKMFHSLSNQGVLVTYCSKGNVRRAMIAAGFKVEKLQGPLGKREMLRAMKIVNTS
jgi:tRNA U34 5-methylaminomethyl-2-thiouridine-forming methyltransferase MnmC